MSLPLTKPLPDHGMDFGPTPRLRSLRIAEESPKQSTEGLTPSFRHSSLTESERSPLRPKLGSLDSHAKLQGARSEAKSTWKQHLTLYIAIALFLAAAVLFMSSTAGSGKREGAVESFQLAQRTLEREVNATFNSHRRNMDADSTQQFVSALLKSSVQESATKARPEANNVEELFNVLLESDITASTSGESVTEQIHSVFGEGRDSADIEEAAEVGFSLNVNPGKSGHKEQLKPYLLTPAAASNLQGNHSGLGGQHLKLFIAELSSKYNLDILEAIQELDGLDESTAESFVKEPLGVASKTGLLDIPPHHLDVVFHSLLMDSPLRVTNITEADIIWVPFWVHKLVRLDQEIEKPNKYDLAQVNFWQEIDGMLPLLGQKPHILVVPGQEAQLRSSCGGFGIDFLCHPRASQFTILSPEIHTAKTRSSSGSEGVSVPVPDVSNIRIGDSALLDQSFNALKSNATKLKLISEAFRSRAPIRKALKTQCLGNPALCSHAEPSSRLGSAAFTQAVYQNDRVAWFSLQPPGETTVRQAFYNSLLAGTIPVTFDSELLQILPFPDHMTWQNITVQVQPENITSRKKLIADILKAYNVSARLLKLAEIHRLRNLLHYKSKPDISVVSFDNLTASSHRDDAFTMSLKSLLQALCHGKQLPAGRCPTLKPLRKP